MDEHLGVCGRCWWECDLAPAGAVVLCAFPCLSRLSCAFATHPWEWCSGKLCSRSRLGNTMLQRSGFLSFQWENLLRPSSQSAPRAVFHTGQALPKLAFPASRIVEPMSFSYLRQLQRHPLSRYQPSQLLPKRPCYGQARVCGNGGLSSSGSAMWMLGLVLVLRYWLEHRGRVSAGEKRRALSEQWRGGRK